jgi:hypothetical protein
MAACRKFALPRSYQKRDNIDRGTNEKNINLPAKVWSSIQLAAHDFCDKIPLQNV